jgi:predicted phosphodiesterase
MKVQVFSDLHLDVMPIKKVTIVDDVHAVIVAGDIRRVLTQMAISSAAGGDGSEGEA